MEAKEPIIPETMTTEQVDNAQASAAASAAQPVINLFDLPNNISEDNKNRAIEVLKAVGILDQDGNPCKVKSDSYTQGDMLARKNSQVSLRTMVSAGYFPCYVEGNRGIHSNNLDTLEKSLNESGSTFFDEPGKVVWAKAAMEVGLVLFSFDGQEVKDPSKFFIVIDGQHRVSCCYEKPGINLWLEFVNVEAPDIMAFVGRLNNSRKAWDATDIRHSVMTQQKGNVPILEEIDKFKTEFGVTDKYAEMALTRKKDQFKRSELNDIQQNGLVKNSEKYSVNPEYVEVGKNIMYSIMLVFKNPNDLKKAKKIEFMETIYQIYSLQDKSGKDSFSKKFPVFLGNLNTTQITKFANMIGKEQRQLEVDLFHSYGKFVNDHLNDFETLAKEHENALAISMPTKDPTSDKGKTVKIGTPAEVLKSRQNALKRGKGLTQTPAK